MKFLVLLACISMQIYIASSKHLHQTCNVAKTPKAFGNCLLDLYQRIKPDLIGGTTEYDLQPLQPFEVKEHHIHQTIPGILDIKGYFKDIQIFTFDKLQLTSVSFDPKTKRGGASFFLPYFTLKLKYVLEGNVLNKNIKDSGSVELNIKNVAIKSRTDYTMVSKNGNNYIQLENVSSEFLVQSGNAKVVSSDPELQAIVDKITDIFNINPQAILGPLNHMFGVVGNEFVASFLNNLLMDIPAKEIIPSQFL